MPLPPQCEVTESHLVFRELAHPDVLGDTEKLFEHVCFVACTNALRPLGYQEVVIHDWPDLEPDERGHWGTGYFSAEDAANYRAAGYVLAEIRLPAQRMGMPVPPDALQERPT